MRYFLTFIFAIFLFVNTNAGYSDVISENNEFLLMTDLIITQQSSIVLTSEQTVKIKEIIENATAQIMVIDRNIKGLDMEIDSMTFEESYDIDGINKLVAEKVNFLHEKSNVLFEANKNIRSILSDTQIKKLDTILKKRGNN